MQDALGTGDRDIETIEAVKNSMPAAHRRGWKWHRINDQSGASWPWNLSTVPIRASGKRFCNSKTWALYGAMIKMSAFGQRLLKSVRLIQDGPEARMLPTNTRRPRLLPDDELLVASVTDGSITANPNQRPVPMIEISCASSPARDGGTFIK